MKKDLLADHKKKMTELHATFSKKTQYHQQKAYLELKEIYWLMHEFFSSILDKEHHFTEEELMRELTEFKHDFMKLPPELIESWRIFFISLSEGQYAGRELSQEELKLLLGEFSTLVDQTLGKEPVQTDSFNQQLQIANILVQNGNMKKAEEEYQKLMTVYATLNDEKKAKYYSILTQLYETILASRSATPEVHQ